MNHRSLRGVFVEIGLLATLFVTSMAQAAPADLDTTFGAGGMVTLPLAGVADPVATLQPDGKLLIAVSTLQSTTSQTKPVKQSWLIRRYTADGLPDASFGVDDSAVASFDVYGGLGDDYPRGIALQADGRFVVAGTSLGGCPPGDACLTTAIVARFNADGTLDSSFGSIGKVVASARGADSFAVQSDGRILIASNVSSLIGGDYPLQLQRLNVDGSTDNSFAPSVACIGNGKVRLNADDEIVVVTTAATPPDFTNGFCITRLHADGTVDTAFGTQGKMVVGAGASGQLRDFFIDTVGGIVVAGQTTTEVVFRLTPLGSLDISFGLGGMVAIGAVQFISAITGDCSSRTIVAGVPNANGSSYFLMGRFLQGGSIDNSFTGVQGGFAQTNLSSRPVQLLVRPNGRIVALAFAPDELDVIQYQGDLPCGTTAAVEYYYAGWNYYFVTSSPDEIAALDGGAFGGLWKRTGQTFNVWPQPNASASPTCRFFSTAFAPKSAHFYTPFPVECAIVKTNPSWQFESIAFYIQIPNGYGTGNGSCPQGAVALYRAYNNGMGGAPNHRYTTSLAILNTMLAQGWVFEGEANTKVFACAPQ